MERNTTFHEMVWHPHPNGHLADGRWQATEVGVPEWRLFHCLYHIVEREALRSTQ